MSASTLGRLLRITTTATAIAVTMLWPLQHRDARAQGAGLQPFPSPTEARVGDMHFQPGDLIDGRYPWPNGIIPVEFGPEYSEDFRTSFFWSCGVWSHFGAARCVPRSSETTYLKVVPGDGPCASSVGIGPTGGERRIYLHPEFCHNFVMVHEIGHSLGFMHEHQRPDRDNYITVVWDNIHPNYHSEYTILQAYESRGPYDFRSVMHYSWLSVGALTQNPTLVPRPGYEQHARTMGGSFPTELDGSALRTLYGGTAVPFTPIVRPEPRDFAPLVAGNSVTFTWRPPDGHSLLTSYRLRVWAAGEAAPYVDVNLPASATRYTAVLRSGGNSASVLGRDSAGFSASSFRVGFTVSSTGGNAPGPPVLTAAHVDSNPVTLSWVPGPGAAPTSYMIAAGTTAGSSNIATIPVGTLTTVSGNAPVGTPLFVRIIASNAFGSAVSNEVTFTVTATPPGPPTLIGTQTSVNPVTLQWSAGVGAAPTSYTLLAGRVSGGSELGVFPMGLATSITAVAPTGMPLFVRVRATNSEGSATSNEIIVSVAPSAPPLTPVLLTPVLGATSVSLTWSGGSAGDSYVVRARLAEQRPVIAELRVSTPFVVLPMPPSGRYVVSVVATNGTAFSPESNAVVVDIP